MFWWTWANTVMSVTVAVTMPQYNGMANAVVIPFQAKAPAKLSLAELGRPHEGKVIHVDFRHRTAA